MCVRVCVRGRDCMFFYAITRGSVFFLSSIILPDMCGWLYVCSEFLGDLRKEKPLRTDDRLTSFAAEVAECSSVLWVC